MFYRIYVGEPVKQGIGYEFDKIASTLVIRIKNWVLLIRRRRNYMMKIHQKNNSNIGRWVITFDRNWSN